MNTHVQPRITSVERVLPFECVALVLQGGGALGAYQAGVYAALAEAGSIRIGSPVFRSARSTRPSSPAIHPIPRVDRLREFWSRK